VTDNGETVAAGYKRPVSAGGCYGGGMDVLKKYFFELFLVSIVVMVFFVILGIAEEASESKFFLSPFFAMFTLGYSILIMNPVIYGALYAYLRAVRGEKPLVKDIFVFQQKYLNVVLAGLLTTVVVAVGFILFFIPGIIFGCKLAFVPYLIIDRDMEPVEAVKKSWRMTRGYAGRIFLIWLLGIPIAILGLIILVVGIIPASMWIVSAEVYLYHRVEEMEGVESQPSSSVDIDA
jgi:uncharacterized membrane protein